MDRKITIHGFRRNPFQNSEFKSQIFKTPKKSGPKPTLTENSETYSLKFSGRNSSENICDAFDTHDTHVTCESACDTEM